ncbi:MAG: acyl-CoA dehydrogenase [Gemmatimonadaceae bacterium]|nr:acyl-CoA dehydrogenase [Gemmatimonadaceae bacterium]
MSAPLLDPRDVVFQLFDVLDTDALTARPRFAEGSREMYEAVLATARTIAEEQLAPHRQRNDEHEPTVVNGQVVLIPEVGVAVQAMAEAGFIGASLDAEAGGMQLPYSVVAAALGWFDAANVATTSYALLTSAAAHLIATFGTAAQRERFLPAMLTGHFAGTMALTEPDAGSSLADVRTTATPLPDGSGYALRGTKIWISGGDQEITENIIHLVLARIDGAPAGVKGISLFAVAKRTIDADGRSGELNGIALGGLIHKMGWRGTTSTLLNFGERTECRGELIGAPHRGLTYMFQMMNEARIGVGRAATAMACAAFQYALEYARTRHQGRPVSEKDPARPPVAIIEHPDVRRMLLEQKAIAEGAFALILECARLVDDERTAPTDTERATARALLEVLTPIAKSFPAIVGQEAISLAMQTLGGYGFAREYPIEQHYRDNRLNQLHEGTNGIQALDLLGRKVRQDDGAGLRALLERMRATVTAAQAQDDDTLRALASACTVGIERLERTTATWARASATADPALALANASAYLDLTSRVVVGWLWLRQAMAASRALATASPSHAEFLHGKRQAAAYWMRWELPKTEHLASLVADLDAIPFAMRDAWF